MKFTKVQGAGNDFILVDAGKLERSWPKMAKVMCDRRFGVGGDGLLLVLPSEVADFKMRIFNPDGSEAEACGNGLRCLAKYVAEMGLADAGAQQISVETMSGISGIKLHRAGGKLDNIQVGMGEPKLGAEDVPVVIDPEKGNLLDIKPILDYPVAVANEELSLSVVSMGNPHAVYFSEHPVADFPLSRLGPEVERHRIFPNRANFEVARVVNRQVIEGRVWERGVGETLACGTGACAIAVAARLHGYIGDKVDIKVPGGTLEVEWDGVGEVFLSGPAEIVFTGEWTDK